ncbi:unnamed protein product [Adineta steineri]|uniref:EF-hand domain-containing protein n=1 Tax=Adineta steineri TaxID=433720 RepID=A0A818IEF5_9BILA|nr:unnamed protein product [Adineta steineri]CAF1087123.1 unnamed protein product [Adineta steineri]CAF1289742.1 unnamed protein product [Adineta steineri]CAF3523201.1 unnamed protein product [Adineta steineri]CAF3575313.1 unnamed protein product [Adineta steineri]
MGGGNSRQKQPSVPIPQMSQYASPPPVSLLPPARPISPVMPSMGGASSLSRKQLRQYEEANRTLQELQNQMQRGGASGLGPSSYGGQSSYGGPPILNASMPYNNNNTPPSSYGGPSSYPPPSPLIQRLSAPHHSHYPQSQSPFGPAGYRDSDYAAVANIAGLNPTDIALLHREYLNLTRGGTNKIDRVVFRQLLREALIEANNENVDRAIENIFVSIDRNRDGYIDFPEFVGAFRDVLKSGPNDPPNYLAQYGLSDLINEQSRAQNSYPSYGYQSIAQAQQPQVISVPSPHVQQAPMVYGGSPPLVISLDPNQTPYIVNTQGQPMTGQPTTLQCVQLPIM